MCATNSPVHRPALSINDEPFVAAMAALPSPKWLEQRFGQLLEAQRDVIAFQDFVRITWKHAKREVARAITYENGSVFFALLDDEQELLVDWEDESATQLLTIGHKPGEQYEEPSAARLFSGEVPSLTELVAKAWEALPSHEVIGKRLLKIQDSLRGELVDFSFGDKEITWKLESDEVEEDPEDEPGDDELQYCELDGELDDDELDEAEHDRNVLAEGYDGHGAYVHLLGEQGETLARWNGSDAYPLLELGRLQGRERNDESAELTPQDEAYLAEREV